jgi:hypothetical protein
LAGNAHNAPPPGVRLQPCHQPLSGRFTDAQLRIESLLDKDDRPIRQVQLHFDIRVPALKIATAILHIAARQAPDRWAQTHLICALSSQALSKRLIRRRSVVAPAALPAATLSQKLKLVGINLYKQKFRNLLTTS